MDEVLGISIVVPYGGGRRKLELQLDALGQQDLASHNAEVVVSCNIQAELGWIEELFSTSIYSTRFRWIDSSSTPGPSAARNAGWRASRALKVLFCDADDIVAEGWLRTMSSALDDASLVAGRLECDSLNDPAFASWWHATEDGPGRKFRHLPFAPTANLGTLRSVLALTGGFNESLLVGEDIDFCWRCQYEGHALVYVPDAIVHYRLRSNAGSLWTQSYRYAFGDGRLLQLHRRYGARRPVVDTLRELAGLGRALIMAPTSRGWLMKAVHHTAGFIGRVHGSLAARTFAV